MFYHPISKFFDPVLRLLANIEAQTQRTAVGLDIIRGKRVSITSDNSSIITVELIIRLRDKLGCVLVDADQAEIRIRVTGDFTEARWGYGWHKTVKSPNFPNAQFSTGTFLVHLAQALTSAAN